jgi:hypothetical protein
VTYARAGQHLFPKVRYALKPRRAADASVFGPQAGNDGVRGGDPPRRARASTPGRVERISDHLRHGKRHPKWVVATSRKVPTSQDARLCPHQAENGDSRRLTTRSNSDGLNLAKAEPTHLPPCHLKLSLVSCPIALIPAISTSEKVLFRG